MKGKTEAAHGALSRRIMKVVAIFSGAETFSILCSVIKMKLVALWLHATGVGLFGVFNITVDTLAILTGLGLRQSAVREIAADKGIRSRLERTIVLVRGWCRISGLLGAIIISSLSPWLSLLFFKDYTYWWQFMLLSGTMLFNSLASGEQAILQGLSRFRNIAKASVWANVIGLAVSLPLFRFAGEKGPVLSILAYSAAALLTVMTVRDRSVGLREAKLHDCDRKLTFVRLGGYIALATFATNLAQLLFITWLNRGYGTVETGYYQAGNTLIVRYTAIILTAVGLEFYPRLSASAKHPRRMELFVSHELTLLTLVVSPLVLLFLIFRRFLVELLYTGSFDVIVPFITIGIVSVMSRLYSTALGYTVLAKGDGRIYLVTESVDAAIGLALNVWLYSVYGLTGIGIATVVWFFIYALLVSAIYFFRYHLSIKGKALATFLLSLAVTAAAMFSSIYLPGIITDIVLSAAAFLYIFILMRHLGLFIAHRSSRT